MIAILSVFLVSLCLYGFMGVYIIAINPGRRLNQIFFAISVVLVLMCLCGVLLQVQETAGRAMVFYKLGSFAFIVCLTLLVFFGLYQTNIINRWYAYLFFSIPSLFFIGVIYFELDAALEFVMVGDNWRVVMTHTPLWLASYYAYIMAYTTFMAVLYYLWKKRTAVRKQKKQASIFIASLLVCSIFKVIDDVVLVQFFPLKIPGLPSVYLLILTLGIWVLIMKYRFLSITPAYVSDSIIQNIDELVLLLDKRGGVFVANDNAKSLFGAETVTETVLSGAVPEYDRLKGEISLLLREESDDFKERIAVVSAIINLSLLPLVFVIKLFLCHHQQQR